MKQKFLLNLLLLLFLNFLIKPFWIYVDIKVQNVVGESVYGFYFVVFNLSFVLNILLDLGITNFNNKNISQHQFLLQKHLGNIITIRLFLFIIYVIVVFSVAFILGYSGYKLYLLSILIFNQFLAAFIMYLRSNLSGLHLFKTDSLISVLDKSLMIMIVGIMLWGGVIKQTFKIEFFVYAQTVSYFITFCITLFIVLHKSGKIRLKFNKFFFLAFFKKSYPYALLILLMSFYNRFDSVLIDTLLPENGSEIAESMTGHFQAGVYAQAYRILDGVSQFGYLFAVLLLPIFARMIKLKEDLGDMILLSFSLIIVPAIIITISSSAYSNDIMSLLYNEGASFSGPVFAVIIYGFIAICSTYILGTLLTANGSLKALNIMALIGISINVVANLIFIPNYQALGASYSSLITQFFTAITQLCIAWYIFKLKVNYKFIAKLISLILFSFLMVWISQKYIGVFYVGFFTSVLLSIIYAFLIRLISIRNLLLIIKDSKAK